MAEKQCECEVSSILVFPCSGGSNVGQIANAAGIALSKRGRTNFYCLAGMGAHVAGMVDSAQHADYRIAIDGCPVACARKTLEQAGVPVEKAIVVTALGIAKNHEFTWSYDELDIVVAAALEDTPSVAADDNGCGCGCSGESK
ncbi:MAG: putative zinc-binding protein [Anaerolineae bacterium]